MTNDSVSESPKSDNLKQCMKCGEWKLNTTEYFYKKPDAKSGISAECRKCRAARYKQWKLDNPKELREAKRKWKLENPDVKHCSQCGALKPATLDHFGPRKDSGDGLQAECRDCYSERCSRWHKNNRERSRELNRRWRRANPVKVRASANKWRRANPDKVRAATARRYRANPEKFRQWRLDHPDKYRELKRCSERNRRAIKRQAEGTHTVADIKALYKSQRGKCWYCGKKVGDKYDVDHRVPLSRGGSNAPENLVIACEFCNRSKRDRLPHEWCGRLL